MANCNYCNTLYDYWPGGRAEQSTLLMDPSAATIQAFFVLLFAKAVLKFPSCRCRDIDATARRDVIARQRLTNFYKP